MKKNSETKYADDDSLAQIIYDNRYLVGLKPRSSSLFFKDELEKPEEMPVKPFTFEKKK